MDEIALAHERGKGNAGIDLLKLAEAAFDAVGNGRGRVGGLLREREQNAVFAVDLRVCTAGIVRDAHGGDIAEHDCVERADPGGEQRDLFKNLHVLDLVADGDQPLRAVLVEIARGHGEVLRGEQLCDHILCEDLVEVCGVLCGGELIRGRLFRLLELCLARFEFLFAELKCGLSLVDRRLRFVQLSVDGAFLPVQFLASVFEVELAAFRL